MMMSTKFCRVSILLVVLATHTLVCAFSPLLDHGRTTTSPLSTTATSIDDNESTSTSTTRRNWLMNGMMVAAAGSSTLILSSPLVARADDAAPIIAEIAAAAPPIPLEMKEFVDPAGLFSLRVPKGFYTLRRTSKGDLPNSKTGKGRRGSSIFTAGNLAKAEVVAVERFPTRVLLEENGIQATGDLSTFPALGDGKAVANLIVLRREKDAQNQVGTRVLDSVEVSPDGKTLSFRLKTEIDVQKPELLLEQEGISQLFRVTVAKCTLNSSDGNIMAIFASALEQDFKNGVDGPALEDTVQSFEATVQSSP